MFDIVLLPLLLLLYETVDAVSLLEFPLLFPLLEFPLLFPPAGALRFKGFIGLALILLNEREMVHYPIADSEQGSSPYSISDGQTKFEILENRENREIIHGVDCRTIQEGTCYTGLLDKKPGEGNIDDNGRQRSHAQRTALDFLVNRNDIRRGQIQPRGINQGNEK